MKIIETITAESFAPNGKVLQFSGEKPDTCFEIIVTEEKSPWRLAMFRVKNTECLRLECHPTSLESFETVRGTGNLLAAAPETPHDYHAFLLDCPVCLHKGVWHNMVTLSAETIVKIAENLEVNSEFFELPSPIAAAVILKEEEK